jgi:hypothetical protein
VKCRSYWKNGILIKDEHDNFGLVEHHKADRRIDIKVAGHEHPESLLRIITAMLDLWIDHWYPVVRKNIFVPVTVKV